MKHFVDIERLREEDTELRMRNSGIFQIGDHIHVSRKIDGTNAQLYFENGQLKAFSRKKELDATNTNRGFWNYAQTLNPMAFELYPNWHFYGEWEVKHTVEYKSEVYNNWYVYDIYNDSTKMYLPQDKVKEWCQRWGFNYIEECYDGEFISWEHIRQFLHTPSIYGDMNEGIVVKNQEHLTQDEVEDNKQPSYIKIVNAEFSEVKAHKENKVKVDHTEENNKARIILETIITPQRIEKEIHKMQDEGIIPEQLESKDMKIIAQKLPKRIVEDCLKEEKEVFLSAGTNAGKVVNHLVMTYARNYVLG